MVGVCQGSSPHNDGLGLQTKVVRGSLLPHLGGTPIAAWWYDGRGWVMVWGGPLATLGDTPIAAWWYDGQGWVMVWGGPLASLGDTPIAALWYGGRGLRRCTPPPLPLQCRGPMGERGARRERLKSTTPEVPSLERG